jgi:Flp pilus assembly protein TadD
LRPTLDHAVSTCSLQAPNAATAKLTLLCGRAARNVYRRRSGHRRDARRLPRLRRRHRLDRSIDDPAGGRHETPRLCRRLRQALRTQSGREDRLDRLCPGALRALTRYSEAVAVIQTAAVKSPRDFDVLGEYGKALADAGQLAQAKDVLSRAYTPDNPRWDVMSVQGTVADRLGDHASAMQFYRDALKISLGEPGVLTNMGLSLALAKQLPEAERAPRQAVANPKADARMRGDLALVLALEGKFGEAEQVGLTDLSPEAARGNVDAIREMIAQNDSWRDLRKPASGGKPKAPAADAG